MILYSHREDVAPYNNYIFFKKNSGFETRFLNLHTNASGIEEVTTWLNDKYFDHIKVVAVGALVVFTKKCKHS